MPHFVRVSLSCLFIILLIPVVAQAISRIRDADAIIDIRNGKPCFSYPQDEEIRKLPYAFGHLSVSKNTGGVVWDIGITSPDRKGIREPSTSETCMEYGIAQPGTKVLETAQTIELNTPYNVLISVDVPGKGLSYMRRYLSNFCIVNNDKGEPVIVNAFLSKEGQWYCLKPDEKPKLGIWERLFGK